MPALLLAPISRYRCRRSPEAPQGASLFARQAAVCPLVRGIYIFKIAGTRQKFGPLGHLIEV